MSQLAPQWSVAGDGTPRYKLRRQVVAYERLLERAAPGHQWTPNWPWMRHPSGEQLARHPTHGHACDVASPAEDPVVVVAVEVLNPEASEEAFGRDAVANGMGHGDAAHRTGAAVVEPAEP